VPTEPRDSRLPQSDGDDPHGAAAEAARPGLSRPFADLQRRLHALILDAGIASAHARFLPAFIALHDEFIALVRAQPDAALTALIFDAGHDRTHYSARHALLCAALAELAAEQLGWPDAWRRALTHAALSMNIAIAAEQDRLATHPVRLSDGERNALAGHGVRSAEVLELCGVRDELWLETVSQHHDAEAGPLQGRVASHQLARLLHRIDIFSARLSPRANRRAQSGAAATRAVYLDELMKPDEAGAVLVKTVGLYPPGTLVRLSSGELGLVCRRGTRAMAPCVAALAGADAKAYEQPLLRQVVGQGPLSVAASLAPHEVKQVDSLGRLLDRVLELC